MDEPDLNFDDVAIIRAFLAVGRDCEEKVNRLVETLSSLIKEHEVGDGSITHTKSLFKAFERSVVYRNLFASSLSMYPTLMAGIDGTDMAIWLDTAPGNANKTKIKAVLESLLPNLQTRNPDWRVLDKGWPDIELRKPLITLLDAQNQPAQFVEFFEGALNDLKETHVVEMLSQALSDG